MYDQVLESARQSKLGETVKGPSVKHVLKKPTKPLDYTSTDRDYKYFINIYFLTFLKKGTSLCTNAASKEIDLNLVYSSFTVLPFKYYIFNYFLFIFEYKYLFSISNEK